MSGRNRVSGFGRAIREMTGMALKKSSNQAESKTQKSHGKPGSSSDRAKALELTRAQIEKQFGKGSIMLLGDTKIYDNFDAISTGTSRV